MTERGTTLLRVLHVVMSNLNTAPDPGMPCTKINNSGCADSSTPGMLRQGWLPNGRNNNSFWRRLLVAGIIILVSLGIALAVPGKSSDIVTATGAELRAAAPSSPAAVVEFVGPGALGIGGLASACGAWQDGPGHGHPCTHVRMTVDCVPGRLPTHVLP